MSLPNEYVIEEIVKNIDDVVVYRADHPIHGPCQRNFSKKPDNAFIKKASKCVNCR